MGLRDIIEKLTGDSKPEEIEVLWSEADELFYSKKSKKLEEADKQASNLVEATDEFLEEIDNSLSELEDYRDQDDIQVVEDVVENIHQSKKKLVEDFDPSEDIEQHEEEVGEFIQDFNDVSRKEGAVMKRVAKNSGQIASSMEDLIAHHEEIQDFIDQDHSILQADKKLRETIEEINKLESRLNDLENTKELETKIEDVKEKLEMKEEQIMNLEISDEFQQLEEWRDQIEDSKQQKKEVEKDIKSDISRLERGLKKIIYEIENNDTGFEGDIRKLKQLKDSNYQDIEDPVPDLEEAVTVAENNEVLGEKQEKRFRDAVESLSNFGERRERIKAIEEDIEEKESKIDSAEVEERMKALEREKKSLEKELENEKESLTERSQKVEDIQSQIRERKLNLEDFLNKHLDAEVSIKF